MTRKTAKDRRYQVFISHSSRDRWICERLRERIEMRGAAVWLDAIDVPAGGQVPQSVLDGLKASDECLLLLSPASRSSEWVLAEIGMAMMGNLTIVPVLLHVGRAELPSVIRDLNPIDLNDFDVYLQQLAKRIRSRVKKPARR